MVMSRSSSSSSSSMTIIWHTNSYAMRVTAKIMAMRARAIRGLGSEEEGGHPILTEEGGHFHDTVPPPLQLSASSRNRPAQLALAGATHTWARARSTSALCAMSSAVAGIYMEARHCS